MKYKIKYINYFSDGSSHFKVNNNMLKHYPNNINKLDFINYNESLDLKSNKFSDSNKYLNSFKKYNFSKKKTYVS